MKKVFILLAIILSCFAGSAQEVKFEKQNFPNKESEFKEAIQYLNKGIGLMEEDEPAYKLALPLLEKANSFNPDNADLNLRIGLCLLKTSRQFDALTFFRKAKKLNPQVNTKIDYYIGYGLQLNSSWDDAITTYTLYRSFVHPDNLNELKEVDKRITECENGKKLSQHIVNVKISNLGDTINSVNSDFLPLVSANGQRLFFTSRRASTTGGGQDEYDGEYMEDIYYSDKQGNGWGYPKNIGAPVNTIFHEDAVGLSVDGRSLIIFKGSVNKGDLFLTTNDGFKWSEPKSLGPNINSPKHESSACFSPDGNTIYFVSDRPGGVGGRDIWKSAWNEIKHEWSPAVNLGPTINTPYDEEGVFMHPDGKTLYFSSKGHNSIGGYDVFYSILNNGQWSEPENMGIPINTPGDEAYFQMSTDGRVAYYSSYRKEGFGEKDIYRIDFLEKKEPVSNLVLLQGRITNSETGEPLAADIEVVDLKENTRVGKFANDAKTGEYVISLPGGRNYGTIVTSNGYLFESGNFDLTDTARYKEETKDVKLKPIKAGSDVVLKNIFFETASFTLKETSRNELDRIIKLMEQYPTMRIEINGHTDNVGSDEYNNDLSLKRANSVKEYLTNRGIVKDRLVTNGYGKLKPIATNDTPEGRAMNRRIALIVISK